MTSALMSATHARLSVPFLDIDKIIGDRENQIIICCGSGGVGKTTTAAAIAVRAAEAGGKVVVLTIDPARRLAQSLGVGELDNTPRPVSMIDTAAGGSLDAMMLDMKGTFDDVVISHSTPERQLPSCRTSSMWRCRRSSLEPRSTWRWRSWGNSTARLSRGTGGTSSWLTFPQRARPWTSWTPLNT